MKFVIFIDITASFFLDIDYWLEVYLPSEQQWQCEYLYLEISQWLEIYLLLTVAI